MTVIVSCLTLSPPSSFRRSTGEVLEDDGMNSSSDEQNSQSSRRCLRLLFVFVFLVFLVCYERKKTCCSLGITAFLEGIWIPGDCLFWFCWFVFVLHHIGSGLAS